MKSISVIGFDSAWTGNPKKPGAICVLRSTIGEKVEFEPPEMSSFEYALDIVRKEITLSKKCLLAIDQPTIVTNLTGNRPVEKVVGSLISWMGGGVQPSNRARKGMFDAAAPIWRFLDELQAVEDPESAREEEASGLFLLEVFPALALPGFNREYCKRLKAPKYNPERRKTYNPADWNDVINTLKGLDTEILAEGASAWLLELEHIKPKKSHQDMLDAVICALVGLHWLIADRSKSMMIGGLATGYMVAPTIDGIHRKIIDKARLLGVPIDGTVLTPH